MHEGNMTSSGNFNFQQAYTSANQLSGWTYDASGNLLNDGLGNNYTYDPEGKILGVSGYTYVYDTDGNRVSKSGSSAIDHIYFGGREIAKLTGGQWTDLIYGTNGLVAEVPGTQYGAPVYRMLDQLGTQVGTLDPSGVLLSLTDYAPFGQVFTGGSNDPYKFTGKERDTESGNDYFGARYYASSMGRFLSPDWSAQAEPVPYATLGDPQSLNLYAYMHNNPLGGTDPDGHCDIQCTINIALVVANGISRDGGVGPYLRNVGIGALKGLGQAAYTTYSLVASQGNPEALAGSILNQPAAITPSNETQAQAALVTSTTVTVAATLPAAPEVEAAEITAEIPEVAAESFGIQGARAPDQVTPGIENVKGVYDGEHGAQPYSAHYDEFGRQIGRTDYTSAPDATNHPNPHYHTRDYAPGYGPKGKESGPIPGEHPKDQQ